MSLQLGRARPKLIALVAAAFLGDRVGTRRAARDVASVVLEGARDRSREPNKRSLIDQQERSDSLTRPRKHRVIHTKKRRGAKVAA